jgi:hypothetical protein
MHSTDLLIHLFYLIFSLALSHLIISSFLRSLSRNTTYLYTLLLGLLLYWFLQRIHENMYVERFEIDPNIQSDHVKEYQSHNYQQSLTPLTFPTHSLITHSPSNLTPLTTPMSSLTFPTTQTPSQLTPLTTPMSSLTFPTTQIPSQLTPLTTPMSSLTTPTPPQPSCNLTPTDRSLQTSALDSAPNTSLYTYDSGLSTNMPSDNTAMAQLQSFIKDEVSKYYSPSGLLPGVTPPTITTLKSMVAQKLSERMPYINTEIRQNILENLDKLIENHINQLFGLNTLTSPTSPSTPTPIQPLSTNALGQLYYKPTAFMETMSELGANSNTTRTFFDIPRAAYQNLSDEPLAMAMNSTPWYTYQEDLGNGEKMGTYKLYSPKGVAQANDMSGTSGKWLVRPWAF